LAEETCVRETLEEEMVADESGVMRVEFSDGSVRELFFGSVDGSPRIRMRTRATGSCTFASVGPRGESFCPSPPIREAVRRMFSGGAVARVHFNEWATGPFLRHV